LYSKIETMGLLTPKGKKDGKKQSKSGLPKNGQGSKFITNKNVKSTGGFSKKNMTGGSQRGS
jgi:hypothetical protein